MCLLFYSQACLSKARRKVQSQLSFMENSTESKYTKILFVCNGNTCRSPMAEAVFKHMIKHQNIEEKFEVDSAGLRSWPAGRNPSDFAQIILNRKNIPIAHKSRKVTEEDLNHYDYILGMDLRNLDELKGLAASVENECKIGLLGDYNPNKHERIIVDPFFDMRRRDFENCYKRIRTSCEMFLGELLDRD